MLTCGWFFCFYEISERAAFFSGTDSGRILQKCPILPMEASSSATHFCLHFHPFFPLFLARLALLMRVSEKGFMVQGKLKDVTMFLLLES